MGKGFLVPVKIFLVHFEVSSITFLQGSRYWRYDNDVLEPGYPKVIKTGFDGLRGHITAALSVPQYRSRREAVFFFKRGEEMSQTVKMEQQICFYKHTW